MDEYREFDRLIKHLITNQGLNISCIVGAGLSAGSGLSTFRGEEGMYKGRDPMELASRRGFIDDPLLVWTWYRDRIRKMFDVAPNPGHHALVDLEKLGILDLIITQNVDGLHLQAGQSPEKIVEIHGTLSKTKCFANCGREFILSKPPEEIPVRCACGSYQRPAVVWFGEPVSIDMIGILDHIQAESNLLLIIGTSGVVYPVAQLPYILARSISIVNINSESNGFDEISDISFTEKAEICLPKLVEIIRENLNF